MKVRAKETEYMDDGIEVWIIKDKIYDLSREAQNYYYFKSEFDDNHGVPKDQVEDYFVIISDKPRLCKVLGVELNKPFNIKGWVRNPYTLKESCSTKGYYYITNNANFEINKADTMKLIEHPELIEKIPEYTNEQKEIFKALKVLGYNYLVRDSDKTIYAYELKPKKYKYDWQSKDDAYIEIETNKILNQPHLNFINWEDEEPFEIPEV